MSSSSTPAPVSFTIRRPTPISRASSEASDSSSNSAPNFKIPALPRHLSNNRTNGGSSGPGSPLARSSPSLQQDSENESDSSDEEDDRIQDELVTGFDQFGVQRLREPKKKKPDGPLVIPVLENRDWRELARKRKSATQFVPDSGRQATGKDGSVGGLGTRDTINSGPQLSGLQVKTRVKQEDDEEEQEDVQMTSIKQEEEEPADETEEERARRLLLSESNGVQSSNDHSVIPILSRTASETDAYHQDVEVLPSSATLDDYERVPVAQFGAALLRGMGWSEGQPASKRVGKDGKRVRGLMVEPYLPEARPALLGIGAKERVIEDDGSGKGKKGGSKRPERRYVPVVKKEREGDYERTVDRDRRESKRDSRSRSPSRHRESRDRDHRSSKRDYDRDRERRRDDDGYSSRRHDDDGYSSRRRDDDGYSSRRRDDYKSDSGRDRRRDERSSSRR